MESSFSDLEDEDGDKPQKKVIVEDDDAKDGGVQNEVPTSTPSTGRRQPNPTPSPPPTLLVGKEQRAHLEGAERASAVLAAMDELLSQVIGQVVYTCAQHRVYALSFQVQHYACTCTALAQITIK